eukprot:4784378-Lingulodinium_polyedra.AAC.2
MNSSSRKRRETPSDQLLALSASSELTRLSITAIENWATIATASARPFDYVPLATEKKRWRCRWPARKRGLV